MRIILLILLFIQVRIIICVFLFKKCEKMFNKQTNEIEYAPLGYSRRHNLNLKWQQFEITYQILLHVK